MVSADEALKTILGCTKEAATEKVPLLEALGRTTGQDIVSRDDIPPFKNSSVDGFAVLSHDTAMATEAEPVVLTLQSEVAAGDPLGTVLTPGNTIRILTGAPLPDGADAVVPLERVGENNGTVYLKTPVARSENTRDKGEDVRTGDVILTRGTEIAAAHLGSMASVGCADVEVYRKPQLAFLTTGNELVPITESPVNGKIRNSNAYSLFALAKLSGCEPVDLGVARDNPDEILGKIREGLRFDLFVTSGGISVGKYDFVLELMKKAGVVIKFWKVNIKPGMPMAFGIYNQDGKSVLVFCLPGNPVSSVVTYLEFVRPCIDAMMGRSSEQTRTFLKAALQDPITKRDGKRHFQRGVIFNNNGRLVVRSTGNQSSGVLTSLTRANCLVILKEAQLRFEAGEEVDVELLPWGTIQSTNTH